MPTDPAELAFAAVLLLARLGACGTLLPGLGEADIPMPVRLALVLSLVPLLLPVLAPILPRTPETIAAVLALLAREVAIGLWIGWLARLVSLAMSVAGQFAGIFLGLSSLLVPDPLHGAQGTAIGRAIGLAALTLAFSTGLYALPLSALAESYQAVPPGAPLDAGLAASSLAEAGSASLALALRLAAPLLLLSVVMQVAAGLVARLAPQAQVFVHAAPAQTLAGLALLAIALPALLGAWAEAAITIWRALPGAR